MKKKESDRIIEALLFAYPSPITQAQLNQVFDKPVPNLKDAINRLNHSYNKLDKPYLINSIAGGFQLVTNPDYDIWIRRLLGKSNKLTLSNAALDTLAILHINSQLGGMI